MRVGGTKYSGSITMSNVPVAAGETFHWRTDGGYSTFAGFQLQLTPVYTSSAWSSTSSACVTDGDFLRSSGYDSDVCTAGGSIVGYGASEYCEITVSTDGYIMYDAGVFQTVRAPAGTTRSRRSCELRVTPVCRVSLSAQEGVLYTTTSAWAARAPPTTALVRAASSTGAVGPTPTSATYSLPQGRPSTGGRMAVVPARGTSCSCRPPDDVGASQRGGAGCLSSTLSPH